jgi:hydroxymethylpyrimidine pyrophosphatase-like HAD family hydrolase
MPLASIDVSRFALVRCTDSFGNDHPEAKTIDISSSLGSLVHIRSISSPVSLLGVDSTTYYSDIIVIMDKDNTTTKISEPIDQGMLELLLSLLAKKAYVVILTGAILEQGVKNFIEPVKNAIKERSLLKVFPYLTYYFMGGCGKLVWSGQGERVITYCKEYASSEDLRVIATAMAKGFIEAVAPRYGLDAEFAILRLNRACSILEAQQIFDGFVRANEEALGYVAVNNGQDRLIILELKGSKEKQARQHLQNIEIMSAVFDRFISHIGGHSFSVDFSKHYGTTYLDCNVRDKEHTFIEFIAEKQFALPLVITVGDASNDYGFLGAGIGRGTKLSFLVGEPGNEGVALPAGVKVWPTKGPEGTKQILKFLLSVMNSSPGSSPVVYAYCELHRGIVSIVKGEVGVDRCADRGAVIKVWLAGICRADVKEVAGSRTILKDRGSLFGHELVGEIIVAGKRTKFTKGEIVVFNPNITKRRTTGFGEYFIVEERADECLMRIPAGMSFELAVFAEPFSCILHSVKRLLDITGLNEIGRASCRERV